MHSSCLRLIGAVVPCHQDRRECEKSQMNCCAASCIARLRPHREIQGGVSPRGTRPQSPPPNPSPAASGFMRISRESSTAACRCFTASR